MKLTLQCPSCLPSSTFNVAVRDDNYYDAECSFGHAHTYCMKHPLFETLFESALSAGADGYYRDAVGSWAASLERFEEFAMRVAATACGIDKGAYQKVWKELSSSSERQHGAFVLSWLLLFKGTPRTLLSKEREFRNDVVHKGKIPYEQEAFEFGEAVRVIICDAYRNLVDKYAEPLRVVRLETVRAAEDRVPLTAGPVHWWPVTAIYAAATKMNDLDVPTLVAQRRVR